MKNKIEHLVAERARRERTQENITKVIARLTAQSGRLMFVTDAELVRRLKLSSKNDRNPAYRIRESLKRLNKKGLIVYKKSRTGWSAHLTAKGKEYAEKLEMLEKIDIEKPKKWDGRWRIVIFDIWESRRPMRDKLRAMLQKAGFYKVQNSVWIHPYDCEEFIAFLRADMRLGKGVLYAIAEGIENDEGIRVHFNLI